MEHSYLTQILSYVPETGDFFWKAPRPKIQVGSKAGYTKKGRGYVYIEISGKSYSAHRLAWFYVHEAWPEESIDHINRIRHDNRIDNLRVASNGQNRANSRTSNKHGVKGVSFKPWLKENPWMAQVTFKKRTIYLGCFPTKEKAHEAYIEAASKLHGEFFNP